MITFIIGTSREQASDMFDKQFPIDLNPNVKSKRTSEVFYNAMASIIGDFDVTFQEPENNKYNLFCFGSKSIDNEVDAVAFKLNFSEYIIDEVIDSER